ncbi:MAG: DUF3127 domain-containing protein [Bacteroidales bacterium]
MALEIKAKLLNKLDVVRGKGKFGDWAKQEFVVETFDQYPKKICMNVWGDDKVSDFGQYSIGETLIFSVNLESREFKGRWYTDVRAWKVTKNVSIRSTDDDMPPVNTEEPFSEPMCNIEDTHTTEEDLPF